MDLKQTQKSLYIIIYNATMIGRSLGKTFKTNVDEEILMYKQSLFNEIEKLCNKMDNETLTNQEIINTIEKLSLKFNISFGQSQKAINVILKYHYLLFHNKSEPIKKELDCPLDSIVLKEIKRNISLTKIDKSNYLDIQKDIQKKNNYKIDFDIIWDEQNLNKIYKH